MLVGPIDVWWNENWDTRQHRVYKRWRNTVNRRLVEAGHLVYRPHEAFKGAWKEHAQAVNDAAVSIADCLVNLTPPGVPAYGTADEIALAKNLKVAVYDAPPGDLRQIRALIVPLDDPYGAVHRKTYRRDKK